MKIHSTTVICVRRDGKVAMAADGQVTLDKTVLKHGAKKLRRLGDGAVLAGFAGATAGFGVDDPSWCPRMAEPATDKTRTPIRAG